MSKCVKQSIAFVLIFSMILSILAVPAAAEETGHTVLLSQDFEGYPVYDSSQSATFGSEMLGSDETRQAISGGTQHIVYGDGSGAPNGLLSVRQEGENKYLDFRTAAGTYPTIYYYMEKPVANDDIIVSFDVTPGSGRIYVRPYFSNDSGSSVKKIENFLVFYPIDTDNTYVYYNSNRTANNGNTIVTLSKGWNRAEIHFNMTEKTYRIDFKNKETGEIVEQINENLIPTAKNGSGTFDEYFNGITHLEGVEFATSNHGGSDSLTGTGDSGKLDHLSISIPKETSSETTTVAISQDFESYPVYEAGNTDTYGEGMLGSGTAKQALSGGSQHVVWGGSTEGSSNGLLSVRQEGENKYLDFRTAANTYPTIYYHLTKSVTGEDVTLGFDVTPGSGRIYLRPYFSDQSGNTVKSIQNFMIFYPINTDNVYAYYNSNKTANNGTNIVTMAKGWNRVELHFDMTEKPTELILKIRKPEKL